ncbi:hypothetical protein KQ876_03020 [Mycoplasma sp. CSL7491-lung]|uniref:hypothetical protein n=1 Tax=Mycoplasma sp. CSL7491-lung TaxID=549718 RepID=UPI001C107998|nr:hypothetical protein [Mycoplasma sp. CSL7491-lung]MBU4693167.1 hypothetical protein [Mycoplasma sp. CSL7491-lung]
MNKKISWIFNILFTLSVIALVLISGRIIPWHLIEQTKSLNLNYWVRIILSTLFSIIFIIGGFLLATYYYYKFKNLSWVILVVGITNTLMWIPFVNDDKSFQWVWYTGDVIPVVIVFVIIYFLSIKFITSQNITKIRKFLKVKSPF